jgi:Glucodextranase, domain B
MPLVGRLIMAFALVALGLGVLYVGMSGIGKVVGAVGSTVGGFVAGVTATATPVASVLPISDAPLIEAPEEPYTTADSVDLVVTVPSDLAGDADYRLRIYLALKDQAPAPIDEVAIANSPTTIVPVELTKGVNDFTVTIVGPSGESEPSAVARFFQDQAPPKITIESPRNGAIVNRKAVEITGKTQGRSTLIARNAANGASITGDALTDGTFSLTLAITAGVNKITIDGTDPAGNTARVELTVKRGTGKLTVSLSASSYQIKRSSLPENIRLTCAATDPDGRPLAGAAVTFTLSVPGIQTLTLDDTTSAGGSATFKTTIPKGADVGQGSAACLVSSDEFGSAQDYTVITIKK